MLHAGFIDPVTKVRVVACGPRVESGALSWIVIDKPAGMRSVPGKSVRDEIDAATWLRVMEPTTAGPVTIHRLDQETSGLLLLAGDTACQRLLSIAFEQRRVAKEYRAIVRGEPAMREMVIEAPLRPDYTRRPRQVIDWQSGRRAVSRYAIVRGVGEGLREVALEPVTGRTHQLRVHCAYVGTPIVGDRLYGGGEEGGLRLRATGLGFVCPVTGEVKKVRAMSDEGRATSDER